MENSPQCRWHQATPSSNLRGIDLPRPSSAKSEPEVDRLTVRNESPLADRRTPLPSSLLQTEERSWSCPPCSSIPARLSRASQHDEGMNGRWDAASYLWPPQTITGGGSLIALQIYYFKVLPLPLPPEEGDHFPGAEKGYFISAVSVLHRWVREWTFNLKRCFWLS